MKNSSVSHAHVSCRLKVYNFSSFFPKDLRPPDPQGEHLRVHSCPVIFKTFKNPPGSTTETLHYELASVSSTITQELIDHACAKINHDPGKMTQLNIAFFSPSFCKFEEPHLGFYFSTALLIPQFSVHPLQRC